MESDPEIQRKIVLKIEPGLSITVFTCVSLYCAFLLVSTTLRQAYVILSLTQMGGDVWFADEKTEQGYSKSLNPPTIPQPVELVYDACQRRIHGIHIPGDRASDNLLHAIGNLPHLKWITVTPPVAQNAAFETIRNSPSKPTVHVVWEPRHAPISWINTMEQFAVAVADGPAVVFMHHRFSIESVRSLSSFCELAASFHAERGTPIPKFYIVNITSDRFYEETNDWLRKNSIPEFGYHGFGKTIWTFDGEVKNCEWALYDKLNSYWVEKTSKSFATTATD